MAQNTRSKSIQSLPEQSTPPSPAELEILHQKIILRDQQLREQANALIEREADLNKREEEIGRKCDAQSPNKVQEFLDTFRHDMEDRLRTIQEQVNQTHTNHREPYSPVRHINPESHPRHTTPELSPLRLKDVADSIPKYDGQRMSVFQFCQACERALKLIPSQQEPYLVQLILSKLQGYAYTAASGSEYPSVALLLRKLKQIFGPNKSLNQYKRELGNAYMKHNENIFDYIARIKELQTAILDCELMQRSQIDSWTIDNIEHDVLDSFVNGLPSDLLIRLKIEGFANLDDAFARAIQLSKTLETEAQRRKMAFTPRHTPSTRRDLPLPSPEKHVKFSETPHQSYRPAIPYIKPLIPGQPGPNAPNPLICYYCKNPGHMMANCRKLAYRNSQVGPPKQDSGIRPRENNNSENEARAPNSISVRRDTEQTGRQTMSVQVLEPSASPEPQS